MSLPLILALAFFGSLFLIFLLSRMGTSTLRAGSRQMAGEIESSLADAFVFVNRQKAAAWSMVVMVGLPVIVFLFSHSILFALASVPIAMMLPKKYLKRMRKKRIEALEKQLPDALLMMSGALRAGASFPAALEAVVYETAPPISQEFDLLMREIRLGIDLDIAMRNVEKRIPIPDLLMMTAAVTIAREVGGNLAEALESVARTLREKLQMEGKIRALTSQGRMQGIVMTCLPLFLMLVLRFMEAKAMAPLFSEPVGWATLAVIGVMECLGYFWISRITNIDV
ncbi:type II secretion system (T2SS), F family protein [Paraburkholderia xenovorans LB400]|uniref:Type II secretion system protein F n=1 Tax=Paraburkholderia xenovorans (strain LB400) TaxID=266265 RepID=Q13S66_PARXL|nr:type II secretion system F family protein [Paraburkholderia xenovorans]ABE33073.1 Putative type II secretion system protein F [Paraburkholderia xenovorans LB400]AIP36882.1 type II secretion system (T2SS), F family protein [Paraburkholderia xenovorans LB400]